MIQRVSSQAETSRTKPSPQVKPLQEYRPETNFYADSKNLAEKGKELGRAPRADQELTDIRNVLSADLSNKDLSGALKMLSSEQIEFLKDEGVINSQGKFDDKFLLEFRAETLALPDLRVAS